MQNLATVPAAKALMACGRVPRRLEQVTSSAVAREKSSVLFSAPANVCAGPNLLLEPKTSPQYRAAPGRAQAARQFRAGSASVPDTVVASAAKCHAGGDLCDFLIQSINRSGRDAHHRKTHPA